MFNNKNILIIDETTNSANLFTQTLLEDFIPSDMKILPSDENLRKVMRDVDFVLYILDMNDIDTNNPRDFINSKIKDVETLIDVSLENGVKKVITLLGHKSNPTSLYSATATIVEKIFIASNIEKSRFSVIRYDATISDDMLFDLVKFTIKDFKRMRGGEVFIQKDNVDQIEDGMIEFDDHYTIKPDIEILNSIDYSINALGERGRDILSHIEVVELV
jgi:hypothetical protein